jgi:hypothetical protein
MKVCLTHFHSTKHLNFSVSIAKYLNHESIDVCFITNKVFIKKVIEDKYGFECELLFDFSNGCSFLDYRINDEWEKISSLYDINENIDKFVEVEWKQNRYEYTSKDELKLVCIEKFYNIENAYKKLNYDYLFQPLASELDRRIVFFFSKKRAQTFFYHVSLLPRKQFIFCEDELGKPFLGFNKVYDQVFEISDFQRWLIKDRSSNKYLRKVLNNREQIYTKFVLFRNSRFFWFLFSRYKRLVRFETRILMKFLERFRRSHEIGISFKELINKNYIFYTVHQPEEAQTIIRGYHNIDELELIRLISYNLPPSVKLVVKLHPRVEYTYTNKFLKQLKGLPNVLIAKSRIDSLDIAKNSRGVMTISSSIWMECLILNIPCYTFGHGTFDAFEKYPYRITIEKIYLIAKKLISDSSRDRVFDKDLLNKLYQNSFSFERNAVDANSYKGLARAISQLLGIYK